MRWVLSLTALMLLINLLLVIIFGWMAGKAPGQWQMGTVVAAMISVMSLFSANILFKLLIR
jgi:hypothetical protein